MTRLRRNLTGAMLTPWLILAPFTASAAPMDEAAFRTTTLNVQAEGQVKIAPDQAVIAFGVQTTGKTAALAMQANRDRMATTVAALKTAGIPPRDIQTSALNLNGQYAYEPNQPPRLTGYQAVNQVSVVVHDLGKLGPTVDAVTGAGANQVSGIDFGLSDARSSEDEARRQAVKALSARAALYADAAGLRLGRLVNLTENGGGEPIVPLRRVAFADAMVKSNAGITPVEPGQLTVRITVSAIYELSR